ncbi:MAG: PAS domain S-box protein [Rhizobiales bacterium]|nr:PAS domain S-box protein [Hyphomicrobiales bacterium]
MPHLQLIFDRLGIGLGISRVFLFQVHEIVGGGLGQSCLFDWAAPGLDALANDPRNVNERLSQSDPLLTEWAERRRRGETIMGHTRDLKGYLREDFEYQKIKSFISTPIMVNGHWWGHIGFDDCARERNWTDSERAVLETIAYLLGDAIELSTSSLVMSEATRVAMLQTAPDGIVFIDEDGAILEFNPAAEAIFGFRRSLVLGRSVVETLVPPARRRSTVNFLRQLQRGGGRRIIGRRIEMSLRHATGRTVPVELAITEIVQGGRRLFVAYLRDLTDRKRTEAEVARQREALHQSEKLTALGSLLAGVAHELNNPLSIVIGRAVMLEEDARDSVQRERLTKLREAAERCARVSKTFLAMARQSPSVRIPTSLNTAIASALELVAYPLRSSGIEIVLELSPDLPETTADPDQLIQVFVNLFVNADHAMREIDGERRLTVTTGISPDGGSVVAEVRDTGMGIDPSIRARVFEPFFTTKAMGVGTGMGLAVSFGMVAAHGGQLQAVDPPDGVGACIRLSLPLGAGQAAASSSPKAAQHRAAGRRILVVDDEPEIAALLIDILEREGHEADKTSEPGEVMNFLSRKIYDAIFCDLRMPGIDGRNLRRKILVKYPQYDRKLIFVTGDLLRPGEPSRELDGCPIVEKPFHTRAILEALAAVGSDRAP